MLLPSGIPNTEPELEAFLSEPFPADLELARKLEGNVIILGAGGKMGPQLARRIAGALRQVGNPGTVTAVSRFGDAAKRQALEEAGVHTIAADLLGEGVLQDLPEAANVYYLAGLKFGASAEPELTWAMNAYLPAQVALRYRRSRIVAFSTGNVYAPVPPHSLGSRETDPPRPVGEYAQSCLGRERILAWCSRTRGTPVCILRINYAVEPRYGVLVDLALRIVRGEPISLATEWFNVIWQPDACSAAFRAIELARSPAFVLNLTGPGLLSVKLTSRSLAELLGREVQFEGSGGPDSLLSNARLAWSLLGEPTWGPRRVLEAVADWVGAGLPTLGRPTHFEVRDGQF